MLNHSPAFTLALVSASIEYWIEYMYFPSLKMAGFISRMGKFYLLISKTKRAVFILTSLLLPTYRFHHYSRWSNLPFRSHVYCSIELYAPNRRNQSQLAQTRHQRRLQHLSPPILRRVFLLGTRYADFVNESYFHCVVCRVVETVFHQENSL